MTDFVHFLQSEIHSLLLQAEYCQSAPEKLALYQNVVEICKENRLHEKEAEIYCKMANLNLLTARDPTVALDNADNAILANPTYSDVSATRVASS